MVLESAVFIESVADVLTEEGGYVNAVGDRGDRGGETNMGITQPTLNSAISYKIVSPTTTIKNLTKSQATEIYRRLYWEPAHCDDMPEPIAKAAFDWAVISGVGAMMRGLQQALYVDPDGIWGPTTASAVSHAGDTVLVDFINARLQFHDDDVRRHPPQVKFIRSWRRRLLRTLMRASRA